MSVKCRNVLLLSVVAASLLACGNGHQQEKDALRRELRSRFYERELVKAQAELAATDSLLQVAQADTLLWGLQRRVLLDSLRVTADVQGAKIRYIHRKQKEMQ